MICLSDSESRSTHDFCSLFLFLFVFRCWYCCLFVFEGGVLHTLIVLSLSRTVIKKKKVKRSISRVSHEQLVSLPLRKKRTPTRHYSTCRRHQHGVPPPWNGLQLHPFPSAIWRLIECAQVAFHDAKAVADGIQLVLMGV